jgi:hypothetical protein
MMAILVPAAATVGQLKAMAHERAQSAGPLEEWTLALASISAELHESDRVADACTPNETLLLRSKTASLAAAAPPKAAAAPPDADGRPKNGKSAPRQANGGTPGLAGGRTSGDSECGDVYDGGYGGYDGGQSCAAACRPVGARAARGPLPVGHYKPSERSGESARSSEGQRSPHDGRRSPNDGRRSPHDHPGALRCTSKCSMAALDSVRQLEADAMLDGPHNNLLERNSSADEEFDRMARDQARDQESACPQLRMFTRYSLARPFDLIVPFVFSGR